MELRAEDFGAVESLARLDPADYVPAGIPAWMGSPAAWAKRVGTTAADKRRNVTITIPAGTV